MGNLDVAKKSNAIDWNIGKSPTIFIDERTKLLWQEVYYKKKINVDP